MFTFFKPQPLFTESEMTELLDAVREAEDGTSGEIRIYIEETCEYMDPMIRATELFVTLKMQETEHRNAVLIYIAHRDKDFALLSDKEMFAVTEQKFWSNESAKLASGFHNKQYKESLRLCIMNIGNELKKYFPFHGENRNELPDEIVFGK